MIRFWIIFLIIFLIPLYGFSQEEFGSEEVGPSIQSILERSLPPNPDRVIKIDSKTGTIIVRDTPSNQREISNILREIDIGPQQITIEARIVELKATDTSEIGLDWGNSFVWYDFTGAPLDQRDVSKMVTGGTSPGSQGNLIDFSQNTSEGLAMQIARLKPLQFDVVIQALARNDKANLLSAPKITTINGQPANIQIVRSYPYVSEVDVENTGTASFPIWTYDYTIEQEEVGITLVVTPRVGEDTKIIQLELEPEIEVVACRIILVPGIGDNLGIPIIDRRSVKTTIKVESGETVVMGGLLDDADTEEVHKVPILGDIPLLGNLFRNTYKTRIKKNLLLFVTASLINPEGEEVTD